MTDLEQCVMHAIATNTSRKPAIVASLQESLAADPAELDAAVKNLRTIGAINDATLMRPGTPIQHAIWPTGITRLRPYGRSYPRPRLYRAVGDLQSTPEKPVMNIECKPRKRGELQRQVTSLLLQHPMSANDLAKALNTSTENIKFLMRRLRQDGVASQDDNLCWRLESSPVASKRIEPANPLPDKGEKPKAIPTATAAISRCDSQKNVQSAADPASTQTAAPSFRFGAWDDDSLVIIGPEGVIELPAEAARRLVVFLNHHFSQQNI